MAKICCFSLHYQPQLRRNHVVQFQCCSNSNTPNSRSKRETPQILKIAVSGVTELLRLFSPSQQSRSLLVAIFFTYHQHLYQSIFGLALKRGKLMFSTLKIVAFEYSNLSLARFNVKPNTHLIFDSHFHSLMCSGNIEKQIDEFPVSSVDDVLTIIKSDYDNAYFVTGNFTSSIYTEDCIFEDPTIKFRGRELYARNLKLLVPFFDSASIRLQNIDKDVDSNTNFVLASWNLRTNLKLPWRPLISIDGSTYYELNEDFKIVRHVESWNVSALEAVLQIFNFKSKDSGD